MTMFFVHGQRKRGCKTESEQAATERNKAKKRVLSQAICFRMRLHLPLCLIASRPAGLPFQTDGQTFVGMVVFKHQITDK